MASIAASQADQPASSRRLLDEARALADGLEDPGATLMTYQARALNGFLDGDLEAVSSAATSGARLSRDIGDLYSLDMMLMNHGFAALLCRDLPTAEQRFSEALRIARQLDDRLAQCYLLGALGCCAPGRASRGWRRSCSVRWRTCASKWVPPSTPEWLQHSRMPPRPRPRRSAKPDSRWSSRPASS